MLLFYIFKNYLANKCALYDFICYVFSFSFQLKLFLIKIPLNIIIKGRNFPVTAYISQNLFKANLLIVHQILMLSEFFQVLQLSTKYLGHLSCKDFPLQDERQIIPASFRRVDTFLPIY